MLRTRYLVLGTWYLVLLSSCTLLAPASLPTGSAVAGLPVIPVPADTPAAGRPMAVLLTGDGGWSKHSRDMARELARRGVSTVAWNSVRYYWRTRTADEAARDLGRIIDYYRARWDAGPVLLIGYSWGADVLPFLANRLPPELRSDVAETAMIGFSRSTTFKFHVLGWLGPVVGHALPTHPEVVRLSGLGVPILCVNGTRERARGCEGLAARGLRVVLLPSGHRFAGLSGRIVDLVLEGLPAGR